MSSFCRALGLCAVVMIPRLQANPPDNIKSEFLKNAVILVIRHAEEPDKGKGLSAEGKARANGYVEYFKNYKVEGQALKLDYLFAAADTKGSHRSRLTLEPTSKALDLAIDSRIKNDHFKELAKEIRGKPHGKVILICWHHGTIPNLLRDLGADTHQLLPKSDWPDSVYNWVIQLRYDSDGRLAHTKVIVEDF